MLRPFADYAEHQEETPRVDQQIDDNVAGKRDRNVEAGQRRRHRFGRAQKPVDGPRLAPDLGHKPSCDHSQKTDWPRELAQAKEQRAVVKLAAPAQPSPQNNECQHQYRASDHYAEGEERNCDRWALVGTEVLEALYLAVEIVGQDKAADPGDLDRETVFLRLVARNREQG